MEYKCLDVEKIYHRFGSKKYYVGMSDVNISFQTGEIIGLLGTPRSGKSTLCFNALRKAGVHYAYANFDDERLADLETEDLDNVLQTLYKIYGKFEYLFLHHSYT